MGEYDKAVSDLQKAVDIGPEEKVVYMCITQYIRVTFSTKLD